jgi:peptidoglycan/xylan/chitin deacetylase (PgdA/CDA1 family)
MTTTAGPMYRPANRRRVNQGFRWKDGKRIAVLVNVPFEGWSEGAHSGIGPMGNVLRQGVLDTNAVSWGMYGAVRGIDRLLRVLDHHRVKASVMVNGVIAELYPEAVRRVAGDGHCVLAHAYGMDTLPAYLEREAELENIRRTVALIRGAIGCSPLGWISPRGTPSQDTAQLLVQEGFRWHGDAYDDDLPYQERYAGGSIIAIPLTIEINDMPWSVRYGNPGRELIPLLSETLQWLAEKEPAASMIDITAHTHVYGRPAGAAVFDRLITVAKSRDDVWIATRDEICRFMEQHFEGSAS